ncbi:uncharacterized protein LOC113204713 [Frankliniella occidentalis]|uniref:Uncharacterized protein LOC113204713 n=1 Tax=Frankliniella occidentalis TaxID=133901 RepID=A0A9C6X673_FRAOC|nr:uncharacterized protein LOC113204713 [Frankliniella occidentalis]
MKTLLTENGDELWTVGFNLTQTANSIRIFRVVIRKCSLTRDACEYWNTWSWDLAVCEVMRLNGTAWAPLVQRIEPPLVCPVQEGHYRAVNASLDFDSIERATKGFRVDKNSWRIEVQLFDEQRALYLCFNLQAKVTRMRVRN